MNKGTERLEAFSDRVFGVALTLLVLEFQIPNPDTCRAVAQRRRGHELPWVRTSGFQSVLFDRNLKPAG